MFRVDPQNPPVPRRPTVIGPDSIGYRKQRTIKEFWDEWFTGENKSLSDLYPDRLRNTWRIVRTLAIGRGVVTKKNQTLVNATKVHPSPWISPFHFYAHSSPDPIVNAICKQRMLPLLPPDVPAVHLNGRVDEGYDPEKDDALLDFLKLAEHVSSRVLFIPRTREGRMGLAGLFDPKLARLAWPTAQEIMDYEQILVSRAFGTMVATGPSGGDHEAAAKLRAEDFHEHEILQILAMARAHAAEATGLDDPETFFTMEIARMQALASKQAEREDYRGAAQTRRDALRLLTTRDKGDGDEDYDQIVEAEVVRAKKRLPKADEDGIVDAD